MTPSPTPDDRIAQLEARIAELERQRTPAPTTRRPFRRITTRLAAIGLALALVIPAGVVLANHQFSDVPTSHQFHYDIDALVDAGVTSGCGGGKFCPDAFVTRGQMAAFMNRLGALAPDKLPKANADKVDGRHANELVRVAYASSTTKTALSTTAATYVSTQITAPTSGYLLVTASVTFVNPMGDATCIGGYNCIGQVQLRMGATLSGMASASIIELGNRKANATITHVFPVAAGARSVEVRISQPYDDTDWNVLTDTGQLTVLFVPFSASGS